MEITTILTTAFHWLNHYLWGLPLVCLLLVTHLFFTVRLHGIQRYIPLGIKLTFAHDNDARGDASHRSALSIALAATLGTGTIFAAATAFAIGGPGALFWLWITGLFGISTKYAESLLSHKYRSKSRNGAICGGPMHTLEVGLGQRWLGIVFCILAIIAAFTIGNLVPSHTMAMLVNDRFKLDLWVTGTCLTVFIAIVVLGGTKSIADVCKIFIPVLVCFYCAGCLIILAMNVSFLLPAVKLILLSAFTNHAAGGGVAGVTIAAALRAGVSQGFVTNQAGAGSPAIAAAAARSNNPARHALVASTGAFWDTVVIGALTSLVIVSTSFRSPITPNALDIADFTSTLFAKIPVIGELFFFVAMGCFLFAAILGWTYFAERSVEYVFKRKAIPVFRYFWVLAILFGALIKPSSESNLSSFIGEIALTALALMVLPNLFSLFALHKVVVAETRKYLWENTPDDPVSETDSHCHRNSG